MGIVYPNKLKQVIVSMYHSEHEIKILQEEVTRCKNILLENMSKESNELFAKCYEGEDLVNIKASYSERVNIDYDIAKIKERLDKDVYKTIINKDYVITDYAAVVKLLKANGVNPKEFLKHVRVLESINRKKLADQYDVGEITMRDLKNCYEVRTSKNVKLSGSIEE